MRLRRRRVRPVFSEPWRSELLDEDYAQLRSRAAVALRDEEDVAALRSDFLEPYCYGQQPWPGYDF
jgi:hypothetical protein